MTYDDIPGWFDFADLYDCRVKAAEGPSVFVEVGVYKGRSFAYLSQAIRDSGKPITLWAVDNFQNIKRDEFEGNLRSCGFDPINVIHGDSADSAAGFADGSVDFVYLDADHSYDGVTRDIRAWKPKMKRGGVMGGHDRVRRGVHEAVRDAFGTFQKMGPLSWWVTL